MDRLLCGDVGYGKTEVAMRAAFKAVLDGKQVAVLAPTTILADQHFRTFQRRFAAFPVTIDLLSRFRSAREQKEIVAKTADGTVDILIATHRMLAKDLAFRDLGLLIVDEEQRFGVAQKERLKEWKTSIDVLSMSATPIPRSLHLSLSGLRDLSIIETPPRDRLAIETQVVPRKPEVIREAIEAELERGGQVFFVHNRVESIGRVREELEALLPKLRIAVAHGAMRENELEKAMLRFTSREADLLLATTIIENGLDIPSANTILIDRAESYGLAQLYQLRGRVGRSDKPASAFLLVHETAALSDTARRRLASIQEFCDLGAGFRIAAKDLEIRGSGNILGGEQSGQIASVGFETYLSLLEESIREIQGEPPVPERSITLSLGLDLTIPPSYVADENWRMMIYKKIARATSDSELEETEREIADRFGEPPPAVRRLVAYSRLRSRAEQVGVTSLTRQAGQVHLRFAEDARVDGGRLLEFVRRTRGARLSPARVLSVPSPAGGRAPARAHRLAEGVCRMRMTVERSSCLLWSPALKAESFCCYGSAEAGLVFAVPAFGAELVERIVARVNDRLITQTEFDKRLDAAQHAPNAPTDMTQLKKDTLEDMIREKLLEERAKELSVSASDAEIEEAVERVKRQYNLATDQEFDAALASSNMTRDDLKRQMRQTITLQKVIGRDVTGKMDVSDDMLRLEYERQKDKLYKVPPQARVSEIVIRFAAERSGGAVAGGRADRGGADEDRRRGEVRGRREGVLRGKREEPGRGPRNGLPGRAAPGARRGGVRRPAAGISAARAAPGLDPPLPRHRPQARRLQALRGSERRPEEADRRKPLRQAVLRVHRAPAPRGLHQDLRPGAREGGGQEELKRRRDPGDRRFRSPPRGSSSGSFSFDGVVRSHGWYDLPPFRYANGSHLLETAVAAGENAVPVRFEHSGGVLSASARGISRATLARIATRVFSLDLDLSRFAASLPAGGPLARALSRGGGRMLRAPSLFEDAVKMLFTTNCTWAATRGMVTRLVALAGAEGRAFPAAGDVAKLSAAPRARRALRLPRRRARPDFPARRLGPARPFPLGSPGASGGGDPGGDPGRARLRALRRGRTPPHPRPARLPGARLLGAAEIPPAASRPGEEDRRIDRPPLRALRRPPGPRDVARADPRLARRGGRAQSLRPGRRKMTARRGSRRGPA